MQYSYFKELRISMMV